MISAKELRIGNWVAVELTEPVTLGNWETKEGWAKVNSISSETSLDLMNPIPLTPEILEKAGFVENTDGYHERGKLFYELGENRMHYKFWYNLPPKGETHYSWNIIARPQHLHQLQNLIFALTGEELNIEL